MVADPILSKEPQITIGPNKVTVPSHYYKVIYDLTPPQKMIAFILPNEGSDKTLREFAVSVDAVEKATELDFFSKLPKEKQKQLESSFSSKAWQGLLSD